MVVATTVHATEADVYEERQVIIDAARATNRNDFRTIGLPKMPDGHDNKPSAQTRLKQLNFESE
jgi:hypothetical protein